MKVKYNEIFILLDYDSMFYKAVSHIVDMQKIRLWFEQGMTKEWMENEIINLSINRLHNMQDKMFFHIEMMQGWDLTIEYFITTNHKNCIRRKVYPEYKMNRKQTKKGKKRVNVLRKWVDLVKKEYMTYGHFKHSEYVEADDLIADRKRELESEGKACCIASIDKDLKQLGGLFFDYYELTEKEDDGTVALNRAGFPIKYYRGFDYVTEEEATKMKWVQVLMGDVTDGYYALKGVGEKKAKKILKDVPIEEMENIVKSEYIKREGSLENYYITKFLAELGSNRELEKPI